MFSDSLFTPRRAKTSGAAAYRSAAVEIQVAGADAHRLVTLLFEGFESAIADAHGALVGGDTERKCRSLTRAIRIIDEGLRAHLKARATSPNPAPVWLMFGERTSAADAFYADDLTRADIVALNRLLVEEGLPPVPMEAASTLIGSGARALLVVPVEVSMVPSALKWPRT